MTSRLQLHCQTLQIAVKLGGIGAQLLWSSSLSCVRFTRLWETRWCKVAMPVYALSSDIMMNFSWASQSAKNCKLFLALLRKTVPIAVYPWVDELVSGTSAKTRTNAVRKKDEVAKFWRVFSKLVTKEATK